MAERRKDKKKRGAVHQLEEHGSSDEREAMPTARKGPIKQKKKKHRHQHHRHNRSSPSHSGSRGHSAANSEGVMKQREDHHKAASTAAIGQDVSSLKLLPREMREHNNQHDTALKKHGFTIQASTSIPGNQRAAGWHEKTGTTTKTKRNGKAHEKETPTLQPPDHHHHHQADISSATRRLDDLRKVSLGLVPRQLAALLGQRGGAKPNDPTLLADRCNVVHNDDNISERASGPHADDAMECGVHSAVAAASEEEHDFWHSFARVHRELFGSFKMHVGHDKTRRTKGSQCAPNGAKTSSHNDDDAPAIQADCTASSIARKNDTVKSIRKQPSVGLLERKWPTMSLHQEDEACEHEASAQRIRPVFAAQQEASNAQAAAGHCHSAGATRTVQPCRHVNVDATSVARREMNLGVSAPSMAVTSTFPYPTRLDEMPFPIPQPGSKAYHCQEAQPDYAVPSERAQSTALGATVPGAVCVGGPTFSSDATTGLRSECDSMATDDIIPPAVVGQEMPLHPEAIRAELVEPHEDLNAQIQALRNLFQRAPVAEVQQVDLSENSAAGEGRVGRKRLRSILIGSACLLTAGILGAAIGATLTGRDESESYVDNTLALRELLLPISGESLDDSGSPQATAFTWIASEDDASLVVGDDDKEEIKQRYAAAVLFFALGGENWFSDLKFLSQADICLWNNEGIGILCDPAGRVEKINLSANGLNGTLPEEISIFSSLSTLEANRNSIAGSIPSDVGLLRDLEWLHLDENQLVGSLPVELTNCQNLLECWVSQNKLSGDITQLFESLPDSLQSLDLTWNHFTGTIPTTIGLASSLKAFLISENDMTGTIPSELGKCADMTVLGLAGNAFTGALPMELSSLTALDAFYIDRTALTGTAEPLCNQDPVVASSDAVFVANECFMAEQDEMPCSCCNHCYDLESNGFALV